MKRNKSIYKVSMICLIILLVIILILMAIHCYQVSVFNRNPVKITADSKYDTVAVIPHEISDQTDTWQTSIYESGDVEKTYTGATLSIDVLNNQSHSIKDWTLRLDVKIACYLNGFWCGDFEVHQFRNGGEIVEIVNGKNYDLDTMKLEHNQYSGSLLVSLQPGDYLVYHPSEEAKETMIEGGNRVGIGIILYFEQDVDLSQCTIQYHNNQKITDGIMFKVILSLCCVWAFLVVLFLVSIITYRKTRNEVESMTRSVINGLSMEYKSLWMIDTKNRTIQLVRSLEEPGVIRAINIAKKYEDYDYAIKNYIDCCVVETERERVWNEVQFDTLMKHFDTTNFFAINYSHYNYQKEKLYFQMAFTKAKDAASSDKIILAYRDVDQYVKEDMLRQQQLEDALSQAEDASHIKSVFLANMSHEIRTPINAILGMDSMILRESTEENVKEYAKDIKNASNTLLTLVNDILDFSKIESGKMELVPIQYQLDSVINDILNMMKPKAEEKGLALELSLNPEIPAKLIGDEIRVRQIIMNLLSNAIKYTNEGSILWDVNFRNCEGNEIELLMSIKDTGIGIRPEDIHKLFSPYERLEETKNRTVEGTGLGLSITQNLLDKMNSNLSVQSEYGRGSVFSFALVQQTWGDEPIGSNLVSPVGSEEEVGEKFHAPNAKLLVVDDVEMNIIVIQNLLKRLQIQPITCLSGSEALGLAQKNAFDLIILDAMMPGMSGEETLKHIREESELNKNTPVIVLTANAIVGARGQYLAAGFSDYLSKPVDGVALEDMIQKYLPKDCMFFAGENGFAYTKEETPDSDERIIKLSNIPEIILDEGIKAVGDQPTYIKVCKNFYETALSRIQMLSDFYTQKDVENFAIQAHALKSSSRLIGAQKLSELALEMEMAGKNNEWDKIVEKCEGMLTLYRTIFDELKNVFEDPSEKKEKKEISEKKLKKNLRDLCELLEAYDFESVKALTESLDVYALPEDFLVTYQTIKEFVAEVDYDGIQRTITAYLMKKEGE